MTPEDDLIEFAARFARTAAVDDRTGFGNLLQFLRDLARELARARRTKQPLDLVVFQVGTDMDVSQVAARMRRFLREEDAVARIGSHRFAVIISDSGSGQGQRAARLLEDGLRELGPFSLGRRVVRPDDLATATPLQFLQDATAALRGARALGRDGVVTWQGETRWVSSPIPLKRRFVSR